MTAFATPDTKTDFPYFTGEHEMFRQTVKRFALDEVAPYAAQWDLDGAFPREIFRKAGQIGLFGIRIDSKWGGAAMDWWATAAYLDGISHSASGGVNMALMVQSEITLPALEALGTDEQRAEFLIPAVAGDAVAALAVSEPGGGSDVAAIKTTARADGDHLVIKGQKLWITNSLMADFLIVAVRTDSHPHRGVSLVLFPTTTPGFSTGKTIHKVGMMCSDTGELFFDNCRIPRRYLLGEWNKGFYYVMENFQGERLALSLGALYSMDRALEMAMKYGLEREAFGSAIRKFQVWKHRLAELYTEVEAARWLNYRALDMVNRGAPAVKEITMAKLFTSELSQRVMYECMQIFGGFGYTAEYPIGRMWRDARLNTIGAGTSEIMKEILAKQLGI
jgi:citronellyl-CoA dehydrogenase